MKPGIVVVMEQRDGSVKRASLEALAQALRLKSSLGGEVTALIMGAGLEAAAQDVSGSGADRVVTMEGEALSRYSTRGYRDAALSVINEVDAGTVVLAATIQGRDLGPALASPAALDCAYAAECTELAFENDRLVATRPVYAGKALIKVAPRGDRCVLSLRPNVFDGTLPGGASAAVEQREPGFSADALQATVTAIAATSKGKKDVAEADVVVSGGRGAGGPEGFAPLEELASVLGAAVGASRAVVDLGWRPHSEQVGQTGKVVSPKLYIACGISGAIQHLAGMRTSKTIVAINKDPEAPIFKVADFGIVGDLFEVVPALTKALKEALAGS